MQKYDILLTYEIKNREIENICLIKRELERRGYSVGVRMQYASFFETPEPIEAEVIAVPAYYRERAQFYTASHLTKTKKIVNLRWEQVFNNYEDKNKNTLGSIKPWGYGAVHLAWGSRPLERMVDEWGVPADNVKLTGHVALDFLRGKLRGYYYDRKTLFEKYDLPSDKRINLFISSFALATYHEHVIKNATESAVKMIDVNKRSQKEIISWFERILEDNKNDIIVYRPHPEEKNSELLTGLAAKQPRFRVISEESIKQWILCADRLYTWTSTSAAEIYASEKGCTILRPVEIPYDIEMSIYNGAESVKDYESFVKAFGEETQRFTLDENMLRQYYYIDENKYSYELVCDAIEEVYKDDKYLLKEPLENPFNGGLKSGEYRKNIIKRAVASSKIFNRIYEKNLFSGSKLRYLLDDVIYTRNKLKNNFVSEDEINEITRKIDLALGSAE